jgi:Tfp pilus assembly protein PilV
MTVFSLTQFQSALCRGALNTALLHNFYGFASHTLKPLILRPNFVRLREIFAEERIAYSVAFTLLRSRRIIEAHWVSRELYQSRQTTPQLATGSKQNDFTNTTAKNERGDCDHGYRRTCSIFGCWRQSRKKTTFQQTAKETSGSGSRSDRSCSRRKRRSYCTGTTTNCEYTANSSTSCGASTEPAKLSE